MEEKRENFYGTFFEKDTVLKVSRWAGIFGWVVLGIYVFTAGISFTQFLMQFVTGVFYQKGLSIIDLISFFTPYLIQLLPGVVYFFGLKFVELTLLMLIDVEENTRRATRKS